MVAMSMSTWCLEDVKLKMLQWHCECNIANGQFGVLGIHILFLEIQSIYYSTEVIIETFLYIHFIIGRPQVFVLWCYPHLDSCSCWMWTVWAPLPQKKTPCLETISRINIFEAFNFVNFYRINGAICSIEWLKINQRNPINILLAP